MPAGFVGPGMFTSNPASPYYNKDLQVQPTGIEKIAAGDTAATEEQVQAAKDYLDQHPEAVTFPDYGYGPTATAGGTIPTKTVNDPPIGTSTWFHDNWDHWATFGNVVKIGGAGLVAAFVLSFIGGRK